MFCQSCGTKNPDNGKFCRNCGIDLGNNFGSSVRKLGKMEGFEQLNEIKSWNKKRKPISYESAVTKMFTGMAFLIVAIVLGVTGVAGGQFWWFWLLIPALTSLGSGVAQYIHLKKMEQQQQQQNVTFTSPDIQNTFSDVPPNAALPPNRIDYVAPDSRYKTGELVPPSVVEGTTRHLEINHEGETMTLPKKN